LSAVRLAWLTVKTLSRVVRCRERGGLSVVREEKLRFVDEEMDEGVLNNCEGADVHSEK
jgi:hypothetical protein